MAIKKSVNVICTRTYLYPEAGLVKYILSDGVKLFHLTYFWKGTNKKDNYTIKINYNKWNQKPFSIYLYSDNLHWLFLVSMWYTDDSRIYNVLCQNVIKFFCQ